jgi:hypothetical protein
VQAALLLLLLLLLLCCHCAAVDGVATCMGRTSPGNGTQTMPTSPHKAQQSQQHSLQQQQTLRQALLLLLLLHQQGLQLLALWMVMT